MVLRRTRIRFLHRLVGVGRALGCMANIVWDRALGYAIERPKSVTTDMLEKWAEQGGREIPKA